MAIVKTRSHRDYPHLTGSTKLAAPGYERSRASGHAVCFLIPPSGNYAAGTQIIVSANPPQAGAQFTGWKGDVAILANPFLPTTAATIPFMAVTITATYSAPEANSSGTPTQLDTH